MLPAAEYPFVDLPPDHSLFHSAVPGADGRRRSPSINFWASNGGSTSERGADSAEVHTRAILDRKGNIMVLSRTTPTSATRSSAKATTLSTSATMSVPGYSFGINVLVYAMTH